MEWIIEHSEIELIPRKRLDDRVSEILFLLIRLL